MNYDFVEVYEKKKQSRWGLPLEGSASGPSLELEDLVFGNPERRDENREAYVAEIVDGRLKKILKYS